MDMGLSGDPWAIGIAGTLVVLFAVLALYGEKWSQMYWDRVERKAFDQEFGSLEKGDNDG